MKYGQDTKVSWNNAQIAVGFDKLQISRKMIREAIKRFLVSFRTVKEIGVLSRGCFSGCKIDLTI